MDISPLTLAAPAKLNLYLHVTGTRADGYHLLDSLAAFVDICDRVTVAPAEALSFRADGVFAAAFAHEDSANNLVVRAARELAAVAGRDANVTLSLTKNLPVASGIGGGSALDIAKIAACTAASNPEAQSRFSVTPGTLSGSPASSSAMRATLRLSSPAWLAQPK